MTANSSIADIERILAKIESYIAAKATISADSALGRTSDFWRGTFAERPNFPSVSDFVAFRRAGYAYGMADERQGSLARESQYADRAFEIFRQSAPAERMVALDESPLGAPYLFEHHGVHRSAAFWTNAVTALRVEAILRGRGGAAKPLRILEIGAGWGCMAHQLHQLLNIENYTIIDLAENLTLSSAYLSSTLGLSLQLGSPKDEERAARLTCALPADVPALAGTFDVIVNSFSLQEMELETVQGYFSWIGEVLAADGVFISFNSHGKSGVRAPSDHPLENLHLDSLRMFRTYPSGLINTIPYEMVLSPRRGAESPEPVLLDALCCLLQFGLGDDLQPVLDAFTSRTLTPEWSSTLRDLTGYFSSRRGERRRALEATVATLPKPIHLYLQALDAFAVEDWQASRPLLEAALNEGLQGFARLRASAKLAILTKSKALPAWNEDFDARLAYPELAEMMDSANPQPFIVQFDRIVSVDLPARRGSL